MSAGCNAKAGIEPAAAGWPENLRNFSFVWTAQEGIDLVQGPAVAVRGYVESFLLASLTGDDRFVYPGFDEAVGEPLKPGSLPASDPVIGTFTNRVLSLTRSGDDVSALGCTYTYNAAAPHLDEYESLAVPFGAPEAGVTAFKVSLSVTAGAPTMPRPQSGPDRAPSTDVFGSYRITGYDGGFYSATGSNGLWPERDATTADCIAQAPQSYERRKFLTTNYLPRSEFPTLPATPGWPAPPAD